MFRLKLIAGACFAMAGCAMGDPVPPPVPGAAAVVELFTSEGCSSCPPADELLASIVDDARKSGKPIIAMEWHVDYWNRLGWVDSFSNSEASARQQTYANAMKLQNVYTPQTIVNGVRECIGSDADKVSRAITAALAKPADARVNIANLQLKKDIVAGEISIDRATADAVVQVILVQRRATTRVARGENGGRTLQHRNIVRTSQTLKNAAGGAFELKLPAGLGAADIGIIAVVQNPKTMAITGSAEASMP